MEGSTLFVPYFTLNKGQRRFFKLLMKALKPHCKGAVIIDHIFLQFAVIPLTISSKIRDITLSDHSMVSL